MPGFNVPNTEDSTPRCVVVDADDMFEGKQMAGICSGICAAPVGSRSLCMHLVAIPPGRADPRTSTRPTKRPCSSWKAPQSPAPATGCTTKSPSCQDNSPTFGQGFCTSRTTSAPLPPIRAVLARTDPNEQASVTLLPRLSTPARLERAEDDSSNRHAAGR